MTLLDIILVILVLSALTGYAVHLTSALVNAFLIIFVVVLVVRLLQGRTPL